MNNNEQQSTGKTSMATKGRWKTALTYGDRDSVVIRGYSLGDGEGVHHISKDAARLEAETNG